MAKRVQVVLKEHISTLGKSGDVVDVAPGFARNFLVPQGKAMPVTTAVLKQVEHHRAKEAERQEALLQDALAFRTALDTIGALKIRKHTGSDGVLFGTVTNGDVAEAIAAATHREVERRHIEVPEIHRVGSYTALLRLHSGITAEVKFTVVGG